MLSELYYAGKFMALGIKQCAFLLAILSTFRQGMMVERGRGGSSSSERDLHVERKLKLLNKPAVKSIQSEDGDIIDCVDIHKQPALDHPLLRNHTIQMKPSRNLFHVEGEADPPTASSAGRKAIPLLLSSQVWLKSGSCPEGTIPIRRVQKHHLLNAPSIENYGKKNVAGIEKHEVRLPNGTLAFGAEEQHSVAVLVAGGFSYTGAQADINVWNPRVEANDEYSSGMISVRGGHYNNADEIEFGWTVNPTVYGDRRTRLYIYWTTDSGKSTGCYDLLCSGFVQTSHEIALGAIIDPVSQIFRQQYTINLYVWKDYDTDPGNWWLVFRNTTTIGYWPASIFKSLYVANMVLFGGDVYSPRKGRTPHTTTAMGSSKYASDHFGRAAYIGKPRIRDYSNFLKYPDPPQTFSPLPNCYSAENYAGVLFTEPLFFYGGPGKSPYCP